MKLMDKLKNALFEEEYVEVEEKPKKEKIKKEKKEKEEKPIAKKIVQPKEEKPEVEFNNEKEELEIGREEHLGEALAYNPKEEKQEFKFPMVSDNEFDNNSDDSLENPEFLFDEDTYNNSDNYRREEAISSYHREEKKEKEHKPYGLDDFTIETPEYGLYEKKEDRTYFKPSPIISPIYGIMDKNYKKDDIKPRKEIKVTSYEREKINVDDVRRKAFGEELKEEKNEPLEDEIEESMLDLTKEEDTPEVNKVTVGDAEEYFEDLGLEYNVDYKDSSVENESKSKKNKKSIENEKIEDTKNKEENDDNLFDLIDSMYDGE